MSDCSDFVSFQTISHSFQNLRTFWDGKEFCDVTLVTSDGGQITAHRLILGLFSGLFRTALARCPNQPHTLVYLAGLEGVHLEQLVKLMYFGELRVERQSVENFLAAARELQIDGIVELKRGGEDVTTEEEKVANNDHPEFFTSPELFEEAAEVPLRQEPLPTDSVNISDMATEQSVTGKSHSNFILSDSKKDSEKEESQLSKSEEDHIVADHNIVRKFWCKDCNFSFKTKKGLWFHNQSKHLGVVHPCDVCNLVYSTRPSLTNHIAIVHKGKRYKCSRCKLMLTSQFSLKGHMKRHRGEKEKCDICDQEFNKYSSLTLHKNQSHLGISSEIHFCKICDWSGTKMGIISHNEVKHNGKVFRCDQCEYKSFQQSSLKSHKTRKHNSSKHSCKLCEKTFHQEAILMRHVQSAHEGVWHFCNECDRSFSHLSSLRVHKTTTHKKDSQSKVKQRTMLDKTLFCGLCNFETSEKVGLRKHVKEIHTNLHKCEMCDAEFTKEEKLEAHIKNKHDNASYNCDACAFRTKFSRDLKQHKKLNHP